MKVLLTACLLAFGLTANATASQKITLTKDNVIVMNDYFYGESVSNLTQKAKELDAKLASKEPLYLILDSGGGSIEAGIELIGNLNALNRPVNTITLFAASMGFQTVQGLKGERIILRNGTLMSHKARGFFYGEFPGQLDSRYSHYLKRVARLDKDVVARTKGKHTDKSYANLIENEYWCDGDDCIQQGFADAVAEVACDQSLSGSYNKLYDRFVYMGHIIEIMDTYSNCPTITTPLSWNIFIDGEPLFSDVKKLSTPSEKKTSGYFYTETSTTAIANLSIETVENIKKLVNKKLDGRQELTAHNREVRKY